LIASVKDWVELHVAYWETLCTMIVTRFFKIQYTHLTTLAWLLVFFLWCAPMNQMMVQTALYICAKVFFFFCMYLPFFFWLWSFDMYDH
jgi:hypothetical protein